MSVPRAPLLTETVLLPGYRNTWAQLTLNDAKAINAFNTRQLRVELSPIEYVTPLKNRIFKPMRRIVTYMVMAEMTPDGTLIEP